MLSAANIEVNSVANRWCGSPPRQPRPPSIGLPVPYEYRLIEHGIIAPDSNEPSLAHEIHKPRDRCARSPARNRARFLPAAARTETRETRRAGRRPGGGAAASCRTRARRERSTAEILLKWQILIYRDECIAVSRETIQQYAVIQIGGAKQPADRGDVVPCDEARKSRGHACVHDDAHRRS